MSHMKEVAAIFGKSLNEPFIVKVCKNNAEIKAKFCEDGFYTFNNALHEYWKNNHWLELMLTDKVVITDV